jgi:hypothetical protein
MRPLSLLLFALLAAACDRPERPSQARLLKLDRGKVEQTMGCNVVLDDAFDNHIALRHACRVPISEMSDGRWWGERPEPEVFTMRVGDCVLLEMFYYCLEDIEPGKSASLRAAYQTSESDSNDILKRLRRL